MSESFWVMTVWCVLLLLDTLSINQGNCGSCYGFWIKRLSPGVQILKSWCSDLSSTYSHRVCELIGKFKWLQYVICGYFSDGGGGGREDKWDCQQLSLVLYDLPIDMEYNKRLDHQRACFEDELTAGSNLTVQSNKSVCRCSCSAILRSSDPFKSTSDICFDS